MKSDKLLFRDLSVGDCFIYSKELYVRCENCVINDCNSNSVNVYTGKHCWFGSGVPVESTSIERV